MKIIIKLTLGFFLLILFSCQTDIVEKEYSDYNSAIADNFHQKGWIPEEFFQKSIINIKQKADLDSNHYYAILQISDSVDWNFVVDLLTFCDSVVHPPKWNDKPKWWTTELQVLDKYCFRDKYQKSYSLAIDGTSQTIYLWR